MKYTNPANYKIVRDQPGMENATVLLNNNGQFLGRLPKNATDAEIAIIFTFAKSMYQQGMVDGRNEKSNQVKQALGLQ